LNPEQLTNLQGRVGHLDREVSGLVQGQASLQATVVGQGTELKRLSAGIDKLIDLYGAPRPQIQVWATLGGFFAILGIMLTFIELKSDPIEKAVLNITELNQTQNKILGERAVTLGKFEAWQHEHTYNARLTDQYLIELRQRVNAAEIKAAGNEVAVEKLSSYLSDVDKLGSRSWINKPSE